MIKFSGGNNIKINKNMIVKHDVRMSAAIVFWGHDKTWFYITNEFFCVVIKRERDIQNKWIKVKFQLKCT